MSTTRPAVTVWASPAAPDDVDAALPPKASRRSGSLGRARAPHRSPSTHRSLAVMSAESTSSHRVTRHQEGSSIMTNPVSATAPGAVNVTASGALTDRRSSSRRSHAPRTAGKQTFWRAVQAEWIKVWSLRSTWITSAITIAITVLIGAGIAIAYAQTENLSTTAKDMVASGSSFGQIVVAVLGALIVTGEYSSGQIRSSLAAVPRRGRLFAAKALVTSLVAFLLGMVSVLTSWAVSAPFMKGHAGSLTDMEYLGYVWGTGLSFVGIALMALGLGYILRSTAGSITVVTVLMFVINIPMQLMSMKWDWAGNALGLLPSTSSGAVADPFSLIHTWGSTTPGAANFLEHWQAALVFSAWAIIPLAVGLLVFSRRDA